MRSARMILATAAATAALAFAAPGAHAYGGDDSHDSSYSKEHGDDSSHDEEHGGDRSGGREHESKGDDWGSDRDDSRFDPDSYKDDEHGKDGWSKEKDHDKPRGGMHTGGGALATPGVTAAGLSVVAVAATGMYALRRRKVAEPAS
ncbi:hypothetical protein [Streptomyces sp. NPDC051636]|uniref:hypothetical protein n=1 Tax=Streptomyces sp. NPDC051636 TaxID=3365663 RepID=UPI0037BADB9C